MTKIKNKKITLNKISPLIKKIISSKIFIAVIFTSLGAYGAVVSQNIEKKSQNHAKNNYQIKHDRIVDSFFDDSFDPFNHDQFFNHNNIFSEIDAEMKRMRQHFDRAFAQQNRYFAEAFKNSKSNFSNSPNFVKIATNQDDKSLIYKLSFSGYDKDDIAIEIKDNILNFKAEKQRQESSDKNGKTIAKSASKSNFYYSLSLPKNIDNNNPNIIRKNNVIEIIFKKL